MTRLIVSVMTMGTIIGCSVGLSPPSVFRGRAFDPDVAEELSVGASSQRALDELGSPFEIVTEDGGRHEIWKYLECGRQDDVVRVIGIVNRRPVALWKLEAWLSFSEGSLVSVRTERTNLLDSRHEPVPDDTCFPAR
jgi:hypothetical protein